MDKTRTNEQRELHQFYLPVKFEFNWTKRFRVRVQKKKMLTDRHINLICGLVTCYPPKNSMSLGLAVLEEKLFMQTRTPQSDDIISAD